MVSMAGQGWVSALSQIVSLCFLIPSGKPVSWLTPLAVIACLSDLLAIPESHPDSAWALWPGAWPVGLRAQALEAFGASIGPAQRKGSLGCFQIVEGFFNPGG